MDQKIAKKWVKALRSGEYKQGFGELRNARNEFCCLGVLCNLHAHAHPKIASRQKIVEKYEGETEATPDVVKNWAGLTGNLGSFHDSLNSEGFTSLAEMNDEGKNFTDIANFIEKNWIAL